MIGLEKLLALAEMARADKSLLPNHLGTFCTKTEITPRSWTTQRS